MIRPLLLAFLCLAGLPAWAHVVATDGEIGVTMHVDPDDAPVTGSPTRFYFWFNDTSGRLNPAQCVGTFSVLSGTDTVASQPLFSPSAQGLVSVHDVPFAKRGVYTVRVTGKPQTGSSFQPFALEYTIRVSPGEKKSGPDSSLGSWFSTHGIILGLGIVVAGLIIAWGLRPRPVRKKRG